MSPAHSEVAVGTELPPRAFTITRADLIAYAGASGDFNVIHWNERVAVSVGLPNVIAHGMFTMGLAINVVTEWAGGPDRVTDYTCRFTRPVVVPDDDRGAVLEVSAVVTEVADDGTVVVSITATSDGVTVLGKARAVVRLA
jgi:acyl dehydratase